MLLLIITRTLYHCYYLYLTITLYTVINTYTNTIPLLLFILNNNTSIINTNTNYTGLIIIILTSSTSIINTCTKATIIIFNCSRIKHFY